METGFAKRTCSNKQLERDDDPKKSHPGLVLVAGAGRIEQRRDAQRYDKSYVLPGDFKD